MNFFSDDYDTDYLYPDSDDRETVISPDEALEATTIRNMGLGSSIFNRNERLDVKKPGPFYKNSANNFFLDKVLSWFIIVKNQINSKLSILAFLHRL